MAEENPTILHLKQSFITAQSRLLSQPLQPSRAWRRANDAAGEAADASRRSSGGGSVPGRGDGGGKLSNSTINDALIHANNTLQQHIHRVYAPQATRHVAEQIDRLYLDAGERSVVLQDDRDDVLGLDVDFADDAAISALPPEWEDEREASKHPLEAKKYAELVSRLTPLSEERKAVRARVEKLRRMKKLLEPFGSGDSDTDDGAGGREGKTTSISRVQQNLVTRNGEVEKELEKMRMLLARVGGRVAQIPAGSKRKRLGAGEEGHDEMDVEDVETREQKKIHDLLTRI